MLYTPGALLVNGRGETPVDRDIVKNGRIDTEAYFKLYERRLLPVLKYAGIMAHQQGKEALITVPGLGCGQFAGKFRGTLQTYLRDVLIRILTEHHQELSGIRAIRYDPYRGCPEERREIGGISFFVRPLTGSESDSGTGRKLPQLCPPTLYEEKDDDFSNCSLFSVVAWDHVSWPGNDFYQGSRATDDGVKAAASDSMFSITGVRGKYDSSTHRYLPPRGYDNWAEVIEENRMKLKAINNVLVIGTI